MNTVKKYYQIQKLKGYNFIDATFLVPQKVFNQIKIKLTKDKCNEIVGFGCYDIPLLASYSRSGTNWIRYIVESLSNRPTPGQTRLVEGNDYVIDRSHQAYLVMHKHEAVILVVRDYRECLLRHHKQLWEKYQDVAAFLNEKNVPQAPIWYIKNIEAFERFDGKKLLVYYEDLMLEPKITIENIAEFLSFDPNRVKDFIDKLDYHFQNSVSSYTLGGYGHASVTTSTKSLDHHSKSNLTPKQILEFDDFYFSNFPHLSQKYLSRYDKRKATSDIEP
ncbi:hypothetical protein H1P_390019 [Hyella patelloides LEGE 07179]|uniref:Sulfotransferase domain-containing protein n=1 Tax=Hyella patelloides LEGE 07179 TaxID=945734 RepID=A0A563VX13_9CYAN|nr:sulfotransferase domain-containing protein [Hyella patelloides]VEP15951.1 hypothetical protein H1P_390019 [Hyella patelloides LEGE 07179]